MAYIAQKPCKFAGQSFLIGESVPAEVIQPGAAKNLVKMGIIAESDEDTIANTAKPKESEIKVVIHAAEGDLELDLTQKGLQAVVDVLTSNVSEAEPIINQMTDGDALILLDATDKRKSVQEAAETRAKSLNEAGEE